MFEHFDRRLQSSSTYTNPREHIMIITLYKPQAALLEETLRKFMPQRLDSGSIKASKGHPAITKGIQKYLISEKTCVFFCGSKNGSDLKSKKKVIFVVVPRMDLIRLFEDWTNLESD